MKGSCRECGAPYLGRADKVFCSDGCRNAFHNRLRRNYRILNAFRNADAPGSISKSHLAERGFDFRYLTHLRINPNGATDYYIYDLGYRPDKKGWVRLLDGNNGLI